MFLDERGTGLRVTWHPERDLVVLSVWQGDGCVGTFRLPVQDVPRLSGLLAAALGDWVDQAADPGAQGTGTLGGSRDTATPGPGGAGDPGAGGGPEANRDPDTGRDPGAAGDPAGELVGSGLSVQQRIRLNRTVLKLRGMRRRLRRSS
jgi:hypothetical protein